jgi:hypothetical protein
VRADVLASVLACARQTKTRIGELLVRQQLITADELSCALEFQRLIKDGSITMEMGTQAMKLIRQRKLTFEGVLAELGWNIRRNISNHDLAAILLEAGYITKPQLDQASWNAGKNCLPLGRNLVLTGAISPSTLCAALTVLVLLRAEKIDYPTAITTLKMAIDCRTSVEDILGAQEAAASNRVRIGELLVAAGVLSESDAMIAIEKGLLNQKSIGQILLEYRMVSPLVLNSALQLQRMIECHELSRAQSAELLRQVASSQLGLEHFLGEISSLKTRVLELLLESGVVEHQHIEASLQSSQQYETDLIRALFAAGYISQEAFRAALRCAYAIAEGSYAREDAVAWLKYTFGANSELETAHSA